MIFQKKGIEKKFKKFNENNTVIVADFDATLTTETSKSSWYALTQSKTMPENFYKEMDELNNNYAPYSIDMLLLESFKENLMTEWAKKEFDVLLKYEYREECLKQAIYENSSIVFRKGVKQFFKFLKKKNIPIFIISAGITNTIEMLLDKNNCNFDNIHIIANKIIFENGIAKSLFGEIVNIYNKNVISEKILHPILSKRPNVLLFGDVLQDANMCGKIDDNNIIKVGLYENKSHELFEYYKELFDIVCTENTNVFDISKVLFGKKTGIKYIK